MERKDKILLGVFCALLAICTLLYKRFQIWFLCFGADLYMPLGIIFALIGAAFLRIADNYGLKDGHWGDFLFCFLIISLFAGGYFCGVDWVLEHVTIKP